MAATATATSVRYAPEDPTLPKPWKGLVDGKTGYLYFWNPETNVTQYERPVSSLFAGPNIVQKSLTSSVHIEKSSQGQFCGSVSKDDNDRYNRRETATAGKLSSGTGSYQVFHFIYHVITCILLLVMIFHDCKIVSQAVCQPLPLSLHGCFVSVFEI